MKKLLIVRHGKSDWSQEELEDIDRPLKLRGINNAYNMANRLANQNIIPEYIISSPANRALHTAIIFMRVLNISLDKITINKNLYFSSIDEILKEIHSIENEVSSIMLFGHNPTFTNFANKFIKNQIDNIPTSGVVILDFNVKKWDSINRNNLSDEYFDYPKNINI
ncbi:histidine phosphatase family protein [Bacteroidota bacterium]